MASNIATPSTVNTFCTSAKCANGEEFQVGEVDKEEGRGNEGMEIFGRISPTSAFVHAAS